MLLIASIGYCEEQKLNHTDGVEKLRLLAEAQSSIRNISMDVVHTFSLDVKSVVMWREVVNNMTLNKKNKKSAQTFLDYVRYTFKLADEIEQENSFSYGNRFFNFKAFFKSPNSLTEKQLWYAGAEILNGVDETVKKRRKIDKYIADVDEKMVGVKTKIQDLERSLEAIVNGSKAESGKDGDFLEKSFDSLKEASEVVMDAITGKRITKSLMIPMFEEIKEATKIEDKLVKILNKILLSID